MYAHLINTDDHTGNIAALGALASPKPSAANVIDTATVTTSATTPPARDVLSMHEPPKTPIATSFSLLFRRSGAALPQDTYMLDHDWLGTFPLFLVPSGDITNSSTCTATFTLLSLTALTH